MQSTLQHKTFYFPFLPVIQTKISSKSTISQMLIFTTNSHQSLRVSPVHASVMWKPVSQQPQNLNTRRPDDNWLAGAKINFPEWWKFATERWLIFCNIWSDRNTQCKKREINNSGKWHLNTSFPNLQKYKLKRFLKIMASTDKGVLCTTKQYCAI